MTLLVKVFRNAEDVNSSFRAATWLVTVGAALNTIGYVFVMEGPGDEYAAVQTAFWQTMRSWGSNGNPQLVTVTFYVSFALLVGLVVLALFTMTRASAAARRAEV